MGLFIKAMFISAIVLVGLAFIGVIAGFVSAYLASTYQMSDTIKINMFYGSMVTSFGLISIIKYKELKAWGTKW